MHNLCFHFELSIQTAHRLQLVCKQAVGRLETPFATAGRSPVYSGTLAVTSNIGTDIPRTTSHSTGASSDHITWGWKREIREEGISYDGMEDFQSGHHYTQGPCIHKGLPCTPLGSPPLHKHTMTFCAPCSFFSCWSAGSATSGFILRDFENEQSLEIKLEILHCHGLNKTMPGVRQGDRQPTCLLSFTWDKVDQCHLRLW